MRHAIREIIVSQLYIHIAQSYILKYGLCFTLLDQANAGKRFSHRYHGRGFKWNKGAQVVRLGRIFPE